MIEMTDREIAVTDLTRDLAVTAGAGAGKTSVLVDRFVRIAREPTLGPERVLAITFTRKAAVEMKERAVRAFAAAGENDLRHRTEAAYISTIHAFAERLLRDHPFEAGIDPAFGVLDEMNEALFFQEARDGMYADTELRRFATRIGGERTGGWALFPLVRDVAQRMREGGPAAGREADLLLEHTDDDVCVDAIMASARAIQAASASDQASGKKKKAPDEAALRALEIELLPVKRAIYAAARTVAGEYAAYKCRECMLDFHDLQLHAATLLEKHDALRAAYADRFRHILLDEAQDTDELQHEIVDLLRAPGNVLFVVGDPKQAIYEFRGANPEIFGRAVARLPESSRLQLHENFRSRSEIVDFVNGIGPALLGDQFSAIDPQAEYGGQSLAGPAVTAIWTEHRTDEDDKEELVGDVRVREAAAVAEEIARLLQSGTLVRDPTVKAVSWVPIRPRHIAVLFRTRIAIAYLEIALAERGIPYVTASGLGFYERAEVLDAMMMLRVLSQPLDDLALAAVLRSPWFAVSDADMLALRAPGESSQDPPPLYPALRRSERLRSIHERIEGLRKRTRGMSASAAFDVVLRELHYEESIAAHTDGVAMLANLAKLRGVLRELEPMRPAEAYRQLEQRRELLKGEAVAPVFGSADDAVVLITVHGAKGLEWPVVCLPDLQGLPQSGRELFSTRHGMLLCKAIDPHKQTKVDAVSTQCTKEDDKRRTEAEQRRLFYVAMTRTRERLILSASVKRSMWTPNADKGFVSPFQFLMCTLPQLATAGRHRAGGCEVEVRRTTDDPGLTRWTRDATLAESIEPDHLAEAPDEPALPAVLPLSVKVTELLAFGRCPQVHRFSHSLGIEEHAPRRLSMRREGGRSLTAVALGTRVHELLERAHFDAPDLDAEVARLLGDESGKVRERLEQMLRPVLAGEIGDAVRSAVRVEREWPLVLQVGGVPMEGVIDLAVQGADGRWTIFDYKSNDVTHTGRVEYLRDYYTPQLELYAHALSQAGLGEVAECALVFLSGPTVHRWRFDSATTTVMKWAEDAVGRIAAGDYAASAGPQCESCGYRTRKVCDIGKRWQPVVIGTASLPEESAKDLAN